MQLRRFHPVYLDVEHQCTPRQRVIEVHGHLGVIESDDYILLNLIGGK